MLLKHMYTLSALISHTDISSGPEATVAQKIRRWPADLSVSGSRPARDGIFLSRTLPTAFHSRPPLS